MCFSSKNHHVLPFNVVKCDIYSQKHFYPTRNFLCWFSWTSISGHFICSVSVPIRKKIFGHVLFYLLQIFWYFIKLQVYFTNRCYIYFVKKLNEQVVHKHLWWKTIAYNAKHHCSFQHQCKSFFANLKNLTYVSQLLKLVKAEFKTNVEYIIDGHYALDYCSTDKL